MSEIDKSMIEDVESPTTNAWDQIQSGYIPTIGTPQTVPTPVMESNESDVEATLEFAPDDAPTINESKPACTIDDILNSISESVNKEINPSSADDLKMVIPLSTDDEITAKLLGDGMKMGLDVFSEKIKNPESYQYLLKVAMEYFSGQVFLMKNLLGKAEKIAEEKSTNINDIFQRNVDGVGITTAKGIPSTVTKNKNISGKDALVAVASLMQGVKRIPLWNSGFYITIKTPGIKSLISYFNTVNTEGYDFGRETGAYYFMYADYKIKKAVLEQLLPVCLVGSNYRNWQNTTKLMKALSIHDYDVILNAFASMIYREGVNIKVVCAEDDCDYSEEILADLSKMRWVDTSKLTPEAISFMKSTETIGYSELQKYHEALGFNTIYKFKTKNKATGEYTYWCFDIVVANCNDHILHGEALHHDMLIDNSIPTDVDVKSFFSINHYRSYLPWIANVKCITEEGYTSESKKVEDKDIIFAISGTDLSNKETLLQILDMVQMEDTDFPEFIEDFILKTKITNISYYMDKCPKCNKVPSNSIKGFVPYDMQMHFFTMSLMRIWKTA